MNIDKEHTKDRIFKYLTSVWHRLTYWQKMRVFYLVWKHVFINKIRQIPSANSFGHPPRTVQKPHPK